MKNDSQKQQSTPLPTDRKNALTSIASQEKLGENHPTVATKDLPSYSKEPPVKKKKLGVPHLAVFR